ncbi:MAG: MerR family transcriptional regulator, partial [Spongiibacteraceae bacterium]
MPRRKKAATSKIDPKKNYLSISALSKEFNVTPRTIRHYEDEGLLEPARRGQTRLFTEEDRRRLEIALLGARLGIHLSKLRELFDLYDNARGDDKRTRQFILLVSQQHQLLSRQQQDLQAMSAELERMEKEFRVIVEPPLEVRRDHTQ